MTVLSLTETEPALKASTAVPRPLPTGPVTPMPEMSLSVTVASVPAPAPELPIWMPFCACTPGACTDDVVAVDVGGQRRAEDENAGLLEPVDRRVLTVDRVSRRCAGLAVGDDGVVALDAGRGAGEFVGTLVT